MKDIASHLHGLCQRCTCRFQSKSATAGTIKGAAGARLRRLKSGQFVKAKLQARAVAGQVRLLQNRQGRCSYCVYKLQRTGVVSVGQFVELAQLQARAVAWQVRSLHVVVLKW